MYLQISRILWTGRIITSVSYLMYMVRMTLGREKCL